MRTRCQPADAAAATGRAAPAQTSKISTSTTQLSESSAPRPRRCRRHDVRAAAASLKPGQSTCGM
jgi:hypothetical protein